MQTAIAVVERESTTGDGERRQGPLRCTPASVRMRSGGDAGGGGSEEATERDRGENAPRVAVHEVGSGAPPAPPPPPGRGPPRRPLGSPHASARLGPSSTELPHRAGAFPLPRGARAAHGSARPSRHEKLRVSAWQARQQVQCALPRTAVSHGGSSEGQISSAFFHRSPPA